MQIDTSRSSPNHGPRMGADISMIVLHATVGSYLSSLNWLTMPVSRVSSHYLIRKDGHIAQLVADEDAAWHAGASAWFDLDSTEIMRGSIGIELENLYGMKLPDGKYHGPDPYPPAQLDAARWLCRSLVARYKIVPDMFVRHLDIAIPRGRKSDPAYFPWAGFKAEVYAAPKRYRVRGVPVYEASERVGKLWGHLKQDDVIVIGDPKTGWLADGRGFVKLNPDELEPL